MKLLFDQNISYRSEKKISAVFLDSKHISNVGLLNKEDFEIWNFAKLNGFTIVTFDSDFFDLSLVKGTPPKIIWFRSGNFPTNKIAEILKLCVIIKTRVIEKKYVNLIIKKI